MLDMLHLVIQNLLLKYLKTGDPSLDFLLTTCFLSFGTMFITYISGGGKSLYTWVFAKKKVGCYVHIDQLVKGDHYGWVNWTFNEMYETFSWYVTTYCTPNEGTVHMSKKGDARCIKSQHESVHTVTHDGNKITFWLQEVSKEEGKENKTTYERYVIHTTLATNKVLLSFLDHVLQMKKQSLITKTWSQTVYILDTKVEKGASPWIPKVSGNEKDFSTVILAENEKEELLDDLTNFMQSETYYKHRGIPWTRGYLFHGAPGCGKTSLIKAITFKYSLDIYILNLNEISDDEYLRKTFSFLPSKCALIIEDIDCMGNIAHDRETKKKIRSELFETGDVEKSAFLEYKENNKASLSELLNQLDGVTNNNGRLLIMTTNDLNILDPALIRPGRIDFRLELKKCKRFEIAEFHKLFMEKEIDMDTLQLFADKRLLSASQVSNVFLAHRNEPEKAIRILLDLANEEYKKIFTTDADSLSIITDE